MADLSLSVLDFYCPSYQCRFYAGNYFLHLICGIKQLDIEQFIDRIPNFADYDVQFGWFISYGSFELKVVQPTSDGRPNGSRYGF
jgi:hypothetical protein